MCAPSNTVCEAVVCLCTGTRPLPLRDGLSVSLCIPFFLQVEGGLAFKRWADLSCERQSMALDSERWEGLGWAC